MTSTTDIAPADTSDEKVTRETLTEDTVLNRPDVIRIFGFSASKLTAEKQMASLTEHGADLTAKKPAEWKIPVSTLISAGWIDADFNPIGLKPRKPREGKVSNNISRPTIRRVSTPVAGTELAELEATIERADADIAELTEKLAVAKATKREAEKEINSARRNAKTNLEKLIASNLKAEEAARIEREQLEEQLATLSS
jgi:hypothetical protein